MLARASRSAWRPAPLVGSEAAKVSTRGRPGASLIGEKHEAVRGVTLEIRPRLRAPTGGQYHQFQGCARVPRILTTTLGFEHALERARTAAFEDLALPRVRLHLRRGGGVARGRNKTRHALGGYPGRLVLSGVRRAQGRFRDGRVLISTSQKG